MDVLENQMNGCIRKPNESIINPKLTKQSQDNFFFARLCQIFPFFPVEERLGVSS